MSGIRGGRPSLMGSSGRGRTSKPNPDRPQVQPGPVRAKKRVLFVCVGNSCRSQMAEGFARAYGSDILVAASAGVNPATLIAPLTKQVLAERNIAIDSQFPKGIEMYARESFDVIVNMSGVKLQVTSAQVREWQVPDPIGQKESIYRTIAGQIEGLVMRLILELRAVN
jgi:arsenate reductase